MTFIETALLPRNLSYFLFFVIPFYYNSRSGSSKAKSYGSYGYGYGSGSATLVSMGQGTKLKAKEASSETSPVADVCLVKPDERVSGEQPVTTSHMFRTMKATVKPERLCECF